LNPNLSQFNFNLLLGHLDKNGIPIQNIVSLGQNLTFKLLSKCHVSKIKNVAGLNTLETSNKAHYTCLDRFDYITTIKKYRGQSNMNVSSICDYSSCECDTRDVPKTIFVTTDGIESVLMTTKDDIYFVFHKKKLKLHKSFVTTSLLDAFGKLECGILGNLTNNFFFAKGYIKDCLDYQEIINTFRSSISDIKVLENPYWFMVHVNHFKFFFPKIASDNTDDFDLFLENLQYNNLPTKFVSKKIFLKKKV